jgi:hypothetical protein
VRWLVRRPRGRRSGSLVFPAPSLTLPVTRRVFEVFRRCRAAAPSSEEPETTSGPSGLGSPSECSPVALVGIPTSSPGIRPTYRASLPHGSRRELDLADLAACPVLRSRVSRLPSTGMPSERPLPRIDIAADPVRSRGCLPRNRVPPSWFCTTSAASSAREVAGLLHPAASHGVRRVSCLGFRVDPATWTSQAPSRRSTEAFPATLFTPLEEFPPTAAAPHHCGRCPLAVPPGLARLP